MKMKISIKMMKKIALSHAKKRSMSYIRPKLQNVSFIRNWHCCWQPPEVPEVRNWYVCHDGIWKATRYRLWSIWNWRSQNVRLLVCQCSTPMDCPWWTVIFRREPVCFWRLAAWYSSNFGIISNQRKEPVWWAFHTRMNCFDVCICLMTGRRNRENNRGISIFAIWRRQEADCRNLCSRKLEPGRKRMVLNL